MITKQIPKVYRPKRKSRSRGKIKKNEALIIVYLNALMVEFSARIFGSQENFGGGGSQSSSSFSSHTFTSRLQHASNSLFTSPFPFVKKNEVGLLLLLTSFHLDNFKGSVNNTIFITLLFYCLTSVLINDL